MHPAAFEFSRSRGVVWVCDLAGSSAHLNDDQTVGPLEEFIPRLHWMASAVVKAAGGEFIKWTGDGFLAWFETPLHRDLPKIANLVVRAASDVTVMVNVTQLGVKSPKKFKLRHGITYEQDALVSKITYKEGIATLDLIGRDVVLAFRLSGVTAAFPCIVTQKTIVDAVKKGSTVHFEKWKMGKDAVMTYFKNQKAGTGSIYLSKDKLPIRRSTTSLIRQMKSVIKKAEKGDKSISYDARYINQLVDEFFVGPKWAKEVMDEYHRYLKDDLLGSLKNILPYLEKASATQIAPSADNVAKR